jgi:hypothetical protein
LNKSLLEFYQASDAAGEPLSRLTPLQWSQIKPKKPGYPVLKAKAAQTRHAIMFCRALAARLAQGDATRPPLQFRSSHHLSGKEGEHNGLLVELFDGLMSFVHACTGDFDEVGCKTGMYRYLLALGALHRLWREGLAQGAQAYQPFHLRPKCHACQHMVEEKLCVFGNPMCCWGYRDEDFVGNVKNIAQKSSHPFTLEERCLQKLRILAALDSVV